MKLWSNKDKSNPHTIKIYKVILSIFLGFSIFFMIFQTDYLKFGNYYISILLGLCFSIFIAINWGLKYGLILAITGVVQSIWWIVRPLSGNPLLSIVSLFFIYFIFTVAFIKIHNKHKKNKNFQWENEEKYKYLIKSISLPICLLDNNGHVVSINDRFIKIFGYTIEDIPTIDKWWLVAYPDPKYREWVLNTWNKAVKKATIEKKDIESIEYNVTCKSGEVRIAIISGIIFKEGFLATFTDVTEQKKAQKEIVLAQNRYKKAESIGHLGNWEFDFSSNVFWASDEVKKIFGFYNTKTPLSTERVEKCIPERDRVHQALIDLAEQNIKYDLVYDILTEDQNIRKTVHSIAVIERDEQGNPEKISGVVSDITKRIQSEKKLKESEEKYRSLFEESPFGILVCEAIRDSKNRMIDYIHIRGNKSVENHLNINLKEILSKTGLELNNSKETKNLIIELDKMLLSMEPFKSTQKFNEVDKVLQITAFPLGPEQFIINFINISEQIKAEAALRKSETQLHQSQKMDAIGQLAGGIAHDFNNSLAGIIGASEILLKGNNDIVKQKKLLEMIISTSKRAGELTNKLLLFSRKGSMLKTQINMLFVINETVELLSHTIDKNIDISIKNSSTNSTVFGDESMIQNALLNLAINSSHAMNGAGEIIFTLENTTLDSEYCKTSTFDIEPGEYLRIDVSDSGNGMSKDIQSHIFEPFFTTKEQGEGTGIGLATVYGTIIEHNGEISVNSKEGYGSVFHLLLPVSIANIKNKLELNVIPGSGNILLIDDEEIIRITTKDMLESIGYNVLYAENGEEGVNLFAEKHNNIDLIILDMIMPIMGGVEAYSLLREIDKKIPIIISSGFAKSEDIEFLNKQGISGFLHKPYELVELSLMISQILVEEN